MEIRYLLPEDDLFEISGIYERSWKFAYKNIVPQDFLDSIPEGKWADRITEKGIKSLIVIEDGSPVGTAKDSGLKTVTGERIERGGGYGENSEYRTKYKGNKNNSGTESGRAGER